MMKTLQHLGLLVALCAFAAVPTRAETHTVLLTGVDLRPDTTVAAERVMSRIKEAALEVCGAPRGTSQLLRRAVQKSECWKASVANTVARLDNPKLTALYQAQS